MNTADPKYTWYVFSRDGQPYTTDDPDPDIPIATLSTLTIKGHSLEGEDLLKFFDAAGSHWIREEIEGKK